MDHLKLAIRGQFGAGLAMLRECIELCPDDLWAAGQHPRTFWRIAYHGLFYTHFYLMPDCESFTPWPKHQAQAKILWDDDEEGIPPMETTYTRAEVLEYLDFIEASLNDWIAPLDLNSPDSGFPWYPIGKLDHVLVNLRHLGVHLGQLQEILFENGHDPDWVARRV